MNLTFVKFKTTTRWGSNSGWPFVFFFQNYIKINMHNLNFSQDICEQSFFKSTSNIEWAISTISKIFLHRLHFTFTLIVFFMKFPDYFYQSLSYPIYMWMASLATFFILYLCPEALYHLESDNLFRITVVVADWLGWNPYHSSSFCTLSDWLILKFKLIYCWNFLSALLV